MEQDRQKRDGEETDFQTPNMPTLCANSCGFFGSSATNNLCSKCYKDLVLSKSKAVAVESIVSLVEREKDQKRAEEYGGKGEKDQKRAEEYGGKGEKGQKRAEEYGGKGEKDQKRADEYGGKGEKDVERKSLSEIGSSSNEGGVPALVVDVAKKNEKPSNRCSFCNKRVGLMGFKCRCDEVFCSVHRYSDKHNCLFDYKATGQDEIAKANPVVKADKMEKI